MKYHFPVSGLALDTESDLLSLGLITPKSEAVIARVDSASSNDYLELEIVRRPPIFNHDSRPVLGASCAYMASSVQADGSKYWKTAENV